MIGGRQCRNGPALRGVTLLGIALAGLAGSTSAAATDREIRLSDAAERGTFNVGEARASLVAQDASPERADGIGVDYTLPPRTAAGLYAKSFPGGLTSKDAETVRVAVRLLPPDQAGQISAALEIKGTRGVQRLPVVADDDGPTEARLDWAAIGSVNEVVLSISRVGDGEPARGTLLVDVRFARLSPLRRLSLEPWARFSGVAIAGVVTALLWGLASSVLRRGTTASSVDREEPILPESIPWPRLWLRDATGGVGVLLTAALAAWIDHLGSLGPLQVGWSPVGAAAGGVLIGEWWKWGLTGKHLTARELFRDWLVTGMLAVSSSGLAILQAPSSPGDFYSLSQTVAAATVLVYHLTNAHRLATRGQHLGTPTAALIAGAPFVVGMLTALQSGDLLRSLGGTISAGTLDGRPEVEQFLGRVLILLGFNELLAQGLSLVTRGRWLLSPRAHLAMLAVAAGAVASPWVAWFGSGGTIAEWPGAARWFGTVLATMLAQAGLWGEAYLVTGLLLDAIRGGSPTERAVLVHPLSGMTKGAIYSGVFMGSLHGFGLLMGLPGVRGLAEHAPTEAAVLLGALAFPLIKTVIETFDGSPPFFRRLARNYRMPFLYLRGAVVGPGMGLGLELGLPERDLATRAGFGLVLGGLAYAGVDVMVDLLRTTRNVGRLQPVRYYAAHALLGGFIGAAIGFYLDSAQVGVVTEKFHRYLAAGRPPVLFDIYPLVSKWGHLNLGTVNGGVALLLSESLAGVISWSTAAWLFAINRTFMRSYFADDSTPIRTLFTADGLREVGENMIQVLRWGLWMSPIINSFLRPMGEPTWYNQDGAIRTTLAIFRDATMTTDAFRSWSLQIFIYLLAYDAVRILIWLDHMGLRVATLVNLSFLGMDRLEQRMARRLAPAATARCIPEAVKRFTTWGPLLIPYYIPRGANWDRAWSAAEALRAADSTSLAGAFLALPATSQVFWAATSAAASTSFFAIARTLKKRWDPQAPASRTLGDGAYEVTLRADGALVSRVPGLDLDLSRRSYDLLDPAGRALFLVERSADTGEVRHVWPLIGSAPGPAGRSLKRSGGDQFLAVRHDDGRLRAAVRISLPAGIGPAERWTVELENQAETTALVQIVPYLEWVLDHPEADRGHTQYKRLFTEVEYDGSLHALIAFDRHSKRYGYLAADRAPDGFLASRIDFIGRARSIHRPLAIEDPSFREACDTPAQATMDPIASLLIGMTVPARGSARLRLLLGFADRREQAAEAIVSEFGLRPDRLPAPRDGRAGPHPIRHGEIPEGFRLPYAEFTEDGKNLHVFTPFTPRPFDHTLSNALGHVVSVTNRGLHASFSVNSQQNRLTPDWSDIVTRELPGEALYLFDVDRGEWYSPTYHPLNRQDATHSADFGVDGTATFRMSRDTIETELVVFVPPEEPLGVYLLTIRNRGDQSRRFRFAPYFQIVLAAQPEHSGPLRIHEDLPGSAIFLENPRNTFRTGPAFVSVSERAEILESRRGRFFGPARDVARPYLLENGQPAPGEFADRAIAAVVSSLVGSPRGEHSVVVVLGQADDRDAAAALVSKYQSVSAARSALQATRAWWLALMGTLDVRTDHPEFDRYLHWLKYQALAERIWARRGFYQASGAYGFRDQLQDSVNLIWVDPAVARRQILLHASQQFLEGDVVHWFHLLQDGRTGFVGRTHASDNLLWLPWAAVEYVSQTGDDAILDERTPYLESEQPFEPLPRGKGGVGFDPLRSSREDTLYRHCLRAIDLVLDRRMGRHGLPLMGTGDWNDGLDEIGSEGRGESVWLGLFLAYILERMVRIVERKEGEARRDHYAGRLEQLRRAVEGTWRGDRYLRAIHDDGTEIGVSGSGVWEIDALTASWAVMAGVDHRRAESVFHTALSILEKENTILLGWPPLREDTRPYLGRSSVYPEGVRENGMYCHGVQWLVGAARILGERAEREGRGDDARDYFSTAFRLWRKISPLDHSAGPEIEIYGGQPNKQAADMITTFDPGRMIWNGYTGAAGWMLRQAMEGVLGLKLERGTVVAPPARTLPPEFEPAQVERDPELSPLRQPGTTAGRAQRASIGHGVESQARHPS
ncbi:MAG: hypothetical protein U0790_09755 [Isosphaeraceae bacterium]